MSADRPTGEREVKDFYARYHDRIRDRRHNSPYWLQRYAHRHIHRQFLPHLAPGDRVLDAGCGEGTLSCLLAGHGVETVGVDLSAPNVFAARRTAAELGLGIEFVQGDLEDLPFADGSFDVVVSSHVLEHLPDLARGLAEIRRVTRSRALIAMPTCLNPCCWTILGGDNYWKLGRRFPVATPLGLWMTVAALVRREEGPDVGYGGRRDVPHVWRFPRIMRRQIESAGFRVERFEAGPLIVPYALHYLPFLRGLQPAIDRLRALPVVRNLGYGSLAACRKVAGEAPR